jgi:hypothetical protein
MISNKRTVDTCLDTLIQCRYPTKDSHIYQHRVREIKQKDFRYIKDYQEAIYNETYKLGI